MNDAEVKETALIFHTWMLDVEQVEFQKDNGYTDDQMFDIFWEEYNSK